MVQGETPSPPQSPARLICKWGNPTSEYMQMHWHPRFNCFWPIELQRWLVVMQILPSGVSPLIGFRLSEQREVTWPPHSAPPGHVMVPIDSFHSFITIGIYEDCWEICKWGGWTGGNRKWREICKWSGYFSSAVKSKTRKTTNPPSSLYVFAPPPFLHLFGKIKKNKREKQRKGK